MQENKSGYYLLLQRFFFLLLLFTCCRFLFLIFNANYFSSLAFSEKLICFIAGIRYDIVAVTIVNTPVIIIHLLPESIFHARLAKRLARILFIALNIPLLLLSCIDFGLFRFSAKRATSDIFKILSFGDDFTNTVPKMILDFWYVLVIFILMCVILIRLYPVNNNRRNTFDVFKNKMLQNNFARIILTLIFAALYFTGFRGGTQLKPLNILSASQYGNSKMVSLILNTPFSLIKSLGKSNLTMMNYFSGDEAEKISPVLHLPDKHPHFRPLNVVVIILESFGKEYVGSLTGEKTYTPFLDSLAANSLVCTNAYANAKRSIEGIPAVVAGIPALMEEPYITSAYSGNTITSIASLLKSKGYETEFFHGGSNGTMGFDNFSKVAGYDRYFGRKEYHDDNDFDGSWGIFDEPFLQRFAIEMNKMKMPFFTTVFTLSSHHPYRIPDQYSGVFPEGTLPIHQSVLYADHSLKKFFETASSMPWYKNTLFIITPDHTALSESSFFQTRQGMYAIPILYFMPGDYLKGQTHVTTQQIDILPSVMDYLNFDKPYFAFGESIFTKDAGFAMSYLNGTYQLIAGNNALMMDTTGKNSVSVFMNDSLALNASGAFMENKCKAFVQNFTSALIKNKMTAK